MTVIALGLEAEKVSPYFKAPYKLSSIPADKIARWESVVPRAELALPRPNPFIAEDLAMLNDSETIEVPQKVWEAPGIELWHASDTTFERPLSSFYVSIRSPVANSSARNAALTRFFVRMVNESLAEPLYAASVAGFGISVYPHLRGLSIRTRGYSDKHGYSLKAHSKLFERQLLIQVRLYGQRSLNPPLGEQTIRSTIPARVVASTQLLT